MAFVKHGKFIVFEGGEGAGKSTQARLLCEAIAERGADVVSTREPGGTQGAETIRQMLLHPPGEGWGAKAEALLFAAARSDHVEKLIRPSLERGAWVVCDRFIDSSRAYQGTAGELGDDVVNTLHAIGSDGLVPDLTIVLTASTKATADRLLARDGKASDVIGGRPAQYHHAVNKAFLDFASQDPDRFVVIDANGSIDEVQARVMQALDPVITSFLS